MKTKNELREAHGTPEEFERAVWAASNDLFVTDDEARAAILKYRAEYAAAPDGPTPSAGTKEET